MSKDMQVGLVTLKLPFGVNGSVNDCLSICVSPLIDC